MARFFSGVLNTGFKMKIGQDLRLIKKVDDDLIIHHEPINYDLYCQQWQPLSKLVSNAIKAGLFDTPFLLANTMMFSLNEIASEGLSNIYHLGTITKADIESNEELRDNSAFKRIWSFVNELKRRTNVIASKNGHYGNEDFLSCVENGVISTQEQDKALGLILFFTSLSYAEIPIPRNALALTNSQETSLNCTEYCKSLQTLTTKKPIKETD